MKSFSKCKITNSFESMPLATDVRGIHGILPPAERLHMFGSGLYKMLLDTVHNIIDVGSHNKEHKDELDRFHLAVVTGIKGQQENYFNNTVQNSKTILDETCIFFIQLLKLLNEIPILMQSMRGPIISVSLVIPLKIQQLQFQDLKASNR